MIIALDVDDTIAEFMLAFTKIHNAEFENNNPKIKKRLNYWEVTDDLENIIGIEALEEVFKIMQRNSMVENLDIIPGAVEFVNALRAHSKVYFVTAPSYIYRGWCDERRNWLIKNFNAKNSDIVFMHHKSFFNGDILIDDREKYLERWCATGRDCIRMIKPWNDQGHGLPAVDFDDASDIIAQLINQRQKKW